MAVFRIPDIFGADPDPDPALFVSDLQGATKKYFFSNFFLAYYFLQVHFHYSSKM
jgi:hypothetical protein